MQYIYGAMMSPCWRYTRNAKNDWVEMQKCEKIHHA